MGDAELLSAVGQSADIVKAVLVEGTICIPCLSLLLPRPALGNFFSRHPVFQYPCKILILIYRTLITYTNYKTCVVHQQGGIYCKMQDGNSCKYCATIRKVAGLISDGVTGIFY
jgi:hypothetical protein